MFGPRWRRWAPFVLAVCLGACKRPVTGRDFEGAVLSELVVAPEHVRQNVPIQLSFRLPGGPQGSVAYQLAGKSFECTPEQQPDGHFLCVHPGVNRQDYAQGPADVVLRAKDRLGKESEATARINVDFDCPQFVRFSVSPAIGAPGNTATVEIESAELLGEPPLVSRGGVLWEAPSGSGTMWTLPHVVTERDAEVSGDIIARITDRAGNASTDCGIDARLAFGIDRELPAVDTTRFLLTRAPPPAMGELQAGAGAVTDDVGVALVRIHGVDAAGSPVVLAELAPAADGALPATALQPSAGRVQVEAIDVGGRSSGRLSIRERWVLSVQTGSGTRASVRSAVRHSPPLPTSLGLTDRTRDLAANIAASDNLSASLSAAVGFRLAGQLPSTHRDLERIIAGYDRASGAVIAFGGLARDGSALADTLRITWDAFSGEYRTEVLSLTTSPEARGGRNLAFDGTGCGIMFGGFGARGFLNDAWRICPAASAPWTLLAAPGAPSPRVTPVLYDPLLARYAVAAGDYPNDLYFLDAGADGASWRWVQLGGLPRELLYGDRYDGVFYWEPKIQGYGLALGVAFQAGAFWQLSAGRWNQTLVPVEITLRTGFGFSYDEARGQLVVWGHDTDMPPQLDPRTWLLVGDPRAGVPAWRGVNLNPSIVRGNPSLVYDAERETTLVFGGLRYSDLQTVPNNIEEMVLPPASPMLLATVDLGATRPAGAARLELSLGATGVGDLDGIGPGANREGGVRVLLYDHLAGQWQEVLSERTAESGAPSQLQVSLTTRPERFVGVDGLVPVLVSSRWPATEDVPAALDVDLLRGVLELEPGVVAGPRVLDFSASPAAVAAGQTSTLRWVVEGASQIDLYQGDSLLAAGLPARGAQPVQPGVTTTYRLQVAGAAGGSDRRELTVSVRPAGAPPLINSFTPSGLAGARGSTLRLSWDIDRATSLRVLRGNTEVFTSMTRLPRGNVDVLVPISADTSTVYVLEASGPLGVERRSQLVRLAAPATLTGPRASATWSGPLARDEAALFVVEMSEPGYIQAEVSVPAPGTCTAGIDTYLYLLDGNLDSRGGDDDDGVDACSRFTAADPFTLVPRGVYYLELTEYQGDPVAAFSVQITTLPVVCGNGIVEPGEICDDGNTSNGDGCSASCVFEALGVYTLPGSGDATFSASLVPAGDRDAVQLRVLSPGAVIIESFAPAAPACPGDDTQLTLLADDMLTEVGFDDDGGVGNCSRLVLYLDPGTYYLVVNEYNNDDPLPALELVFTFPGQPLPEVEPNGTAPQAMGLGVLTAGTGSATIAASLGVGDEDFYGFSLPAPATVQISSYGDLTDRAICGGIDTELWLYDAALTELAYADDVVGACAALSQVLPAGAYFVRIREFNGNEAIPRYFFDVAAQ